MRLSAILLTATAMTAAPAMAQDGGFGGQSGADMSIEAIEPDNSEIDIGLAGEQPADIARYLLANGAGGAALSPDGQTIAFLWDVTGQPEIWRVPVTGGQPQQMTFRTGPRFFRWTPDGSGLLYSADRDGNEQPGFFWISADGSEERSILPAASGDFRIFGDFVGQSQFVYSSPVRNGSDFDIYLADLDGNSELIFEGTLGTYVGAVSPDGRYAVVTRGVGEDADNLFLLDMQSRELITVSAPDVEDRASHSLGGFTWAPNSDALLYSSNAGREYGALTEYSVETGEAVSYHAPDRDVGDIELCGANSDIIAWTESQDGFETVHFWDGPSMSSIAAPPLPEGSINIDCEAGTVLVRVDNWQAPGELYTFSPGDAEATRVYEANLAGIDPDTLVRPQVVRYTARDGVELQGLLYLPEGAGTGDDAPPVVFSVHGGPSGQSGPDFNGGTQYLVNLGVAVFAPNVRGSTGLGRTYSTLDDRENRLDSVRDLVDLLEGLGNDGLIDPDRAIVQGGSYGGYMVNAVLSEYPDAFIAGISLFGVGNWITALEIASPGLKASDRIEFGDISEQRWRDFYGEMSPVFRADRIRVPVLYSHGVNDPRVDIGETEMMVRTLRENGIEAPFIRFPDEGHGWRKLSNQLFYARQQAAFINEQLGMGDE